MERGKPVDGRVAEPAGNGGDDPEARSYVFVEPSTDRRRSRAPSLRLFPSQRRSVDLGSFGPTWHVYTVDAAAGTFVDNFAMTFQIAAAREGFDLREAK